MLRITIELVPFGIEECKRRLGIMTISNDATGTKVVGNYSYKISKFGRPDSIWKSGKVNGFRRKELGPWDLLFLVLKDAVGKREGKDVSEEVVG